MLALCLMQDIEFCGQIPLFATRFGTEGSEVQILSPRPIPKKFAEFSLPVHSVPPANSRRRTECSALQHPPAPNCSRFLTSVGSG